MAETSAKFRGAAGSGLRSKRLQAAVRFVRNGSIRIIFLDLLVKCRGLLCIGQDVTQRRRMEQDKLGLQRRQQSILDSMFAFVGLYTPDGTLIEANRTSLEAAGLLRDEAIGKPFWDLYYWSYSAEVQSQCISRQLNSDY